MAKTSKPTGLAIARNGGLSFVCTWKVLGPDYDEGQQVRWKINSGNWSDAVAVGSLWTQKTVTLTASDFYPYTSKGLVKFTFQVRGKRARTTDSRTNVTTTYDWSDWNELAYAVYVPNRPTLTAELDDELDNKSTFTWETEYSGDDHRPFDRVQYQTMLVKACGETDGSKLKWSSSAIGWGTGTGGANSSISKTEDTDLLAADSYTRWVRVRSAGAHGASAWRYAKHVYAKPYGGLVKSASSVVAANATTVSMQWEVSQPASHPIDKTEVQYAIETPAANLACPAGAAWTTAATLNDTSGTDSAVFRIDTLLNSTTHLDSCLWVRIKNTHDHDNNWSASSPKLVKTGVLTSPAFDGVVSYDSGNNIVTIKAINNSSVPDSKIAVLCKRGDKPAYVCGIITSSASTSIRCLPWSDSSAVKFGIYAFQGDYQQSVAPGATTSYTYSYTIAANMKSGTVWDGGTIPAEPRNVSARISGDGEVMLSWSSTWLLVSKVEVSWSKNEYAWESTEEPATYLTDAARSERIRVPNLETGTTWYFRIRFAKEADDALVYGPYCDTIAVNLSSAPMKPVLTVSPAVLRKGREPTASWSYDSTDGTEQSYAQVWLATVSGSTVTPTQCVAKTTTAKSVRIKKQYLPAVGSTSYLVVRVSSAGGLWSDWSDPVSLSVAAPPTCVIASTSLTTMTITTDTSATRTVKALRAMPMTVQITGAGAGGITQLIIERAEAYQMDRPDESVFHGYEGEAIAVITQMGEGTITISNETLVGMLDDGAAYRIVASTQDGLGQTASRTLDFEVHWSHQAVMPTATVTMDANNLAALITPTAQTQTGDVCDIYRLSADRPELIVRGGSFGTQYVDPYPTIGKAGGHRIVFRTANGDCITADNRPAWIDLGSDDGDLLERQDAIIDFDGDQVRLPYNLTVSSSWAKDFQETQYLGGSVQGDWNPAVSRKGTISTVSIASEDHETIMAVRRLARYAGVCHVRTPDGSSYAADVQVSETRNLGKLASFELSITRVDPDSMDGLPYSVWTGEEEMT